MTRYKNFLCPVSCGITAALMLAACQADPDAPASAPKDERVELRIAAGIETQAQGLTRATETRWEADDNIGVYMTGYRTYNIFVDGDGSRSENLEYTFGDGSNYETWVANDHVYRLFTPSTKKIYLSSTSVDVYGYYPYSATLANPREYHINVGDQTNQKALDFMTAKDENVNNNQDAVELLFRHRLVKLVFNLRQGDGLLTDELKNSTFHEFSINCQPTTATYNIFTSTLSIPAGAYTASKISPQKMGNEVVPTGYVLTYEAIVLPNVVNNEVSDRTVTITFYTKEDDKITNTFTINSETVFEEGRKYVFNVTINATSITVDTAKFTDQW